MNEWTLKIFRLFVEVILLVLLLKECKEIMDIICIPGYMLQKVLKEAVRIQYRKGRQLARLCRSMDGMHQLFGRSPLVFLVNQFPRGKTLMENKYFLLRKIAWCIFLIFGLSLCVIQSISVEFL